MGVISIIVEIKFQQGLTCGHIAISMNIEKASKQLEALGNPTRLQVYRALVRAGDDGLPVGRLQEKLGVAARC